ncbi:hypothetical protein [Sinorhizobium meliloti]|uniref:hypothetical protein n=1 Tax=Rhizobium meliloti TaxID=382 RepID=UPI0012948CBA|nr:hypothetical protein [Sinorhizobium meliloti]MQW60073.1 hypothetical protein [Sinorhizobium meliloti]
MTDLPEKKSRFRMTRRRLLLGGSLIGGALVVGYIATNPMQVAGAVLQGGGDDPEPSAFGPFIRITDDGWVTIVNKQQELERDAFRRNRKGGSFFCANQIHHSGR